jgi:hypothetical protein
MGKDGQSSCASTWNWSMCPYCRKKEKEKEEEMII